MRRAVAARIVNVRSAVVLMGYARIAIAPHAAVPVADVVKTAEAHAARHRKRRFRRRVAVKERQPTRVPLGTQPAASPEAFHVTRLMFDLAPDRHHVDRGFYFKILFCCRLLLSDGLYGIPGDCRLCFMAKQLAFCLLFVLLFLT